MVDLGGYVIILVETKDKKIKLYGSPADNDNLEIGDEILEVNGKTLEDANHTEVINHIHQCIRSRTICLRVKRKSGARLAVDLDLCQDNVQDAFVIAVEQQARERLERLSALRKITPIDITKLGEQLNQQTIVSTQDLNGFINNSPIYVTSLTATENLNNNSTGSKSGGALGSSTSVVAVHRSAGGDKCKPLAHQLKNDVGITAQPPEQISAAALLANHIGAPINREVSELQSTAALTYAPINAIATRRSSSPYANGHTELLIGEDNKLKNLSSVESNNNKLGVDFDKQQRSRRRSGSSLAVIDTELQEPIKKPPDDLDSLDMVMVVPHGNEDGQPHREMAVDVPDSFVARNKTPPRYPPPKPIGTVGYNRFSGVNFGGDVQERAIDVPENYIDRKSTPPNYLQTTSKNKIEPTTNGSVPTYQNHHLPSQATPQVPPKPVPPPRDHLKIEPDGRLVNKAPAPQLPARIVNNNNLNATPIANKTSIVTEPTREQLDSIKKYQDQLRKRKEDEDRIAAQNEFLNRSLRGSRKLQALENKAQGAINDAFEDEAADSARSESPMEEKERVHVPYAYGDLVAAVQRLQMQLKKTSAGSGISGLEGRIAAVQSLLLSPQFGRALAIHNKIQAVRQKISVRPQPSAQNALREVLDSLNSSQSTYAVELATILTGYEFEALMLAHDGLASILPPDSTSPPPQDAVAPPPTNSRYINEDNIKIIRIDKTTEPLGATVKNDGEAVVIGRVVRGGAAEKSGLLQEGDELLEVNGIEMRGKSVNAVCDILKDMEGSLTIIVSRASQSRNHMSREMFLHVRALFDYDPEEDMYIPCRELGISFRKGDVLHVISQEDPNWWQAYREGEEDQTLAGLVPSLTFQHQRETMRLAAEERVSKPNKKIATSTLLCGTTKKKKKKGAYDEGGYPMYSNDDYDPEEILTYEEVSLFYPRADKKRPIVLIGPPDIGRHELRQRLMENSERFAAAIPHTSRARKDTEIDGQDYHFITRAQFEADILSRKFVEHGEYEKAYYGTSLDAIRSVVNSGKICVLNLHPQSLKILRTSDLKPYVVFVAPPNLENLKIKKDRLGESYKEEDLVDIIDKAREMENKYGHYFDMIIINNDTERAYHDLLCEINSLEREPQWVPAAWVKST
ncbi:protein PALS1 [Anthonomus grandis grandis]|uniref:protein PALS1 n=1 Tax=Anthonomus grandis grandis TaxID=2921223 RepID=UPI00216653EE|nr:protein PALS1 [Anthonomus grandis grandis]